MAHATATTRVTSRRYSRRMRTITVAARGAVSTRPDTATVSLGVAVLAKTAGDALRLAAERAATLIETVKSAGVADDDIQTSGLSLYPQYADQNRKVIGYNVSNNVTVRVRQIDNVGAVVDAAARDVGDEITIGGIAFSIEDDEAAVEQARAAAMADARHRADQYSAAAGGTTGPIVAIDETVDRGFQPLPGGPRKMALAAATPIQAGTQDVVVNVSVTFELT